MTEIRPFPGEVPDLGSIRKRDDGRFEYLAHQEWTLRGGYVERWELAGYHLVMNATVSRVSPEFTRSLRHAGYEGGLRLLAVLLAEGWTPPSDVEYIETGQRSLPEGGTDE